MKFEKIEIKNFRNFEDVKIDLANKNVFFGLNDVGKTNFLYAFRYVFDKDIRKQNILGQHRINGRIHIGGHAFCENQQDALCICSQGRTDSSCQAGPVSQNQIR